MSFASSIHLGNQGLLYGASDSAFYRKAAQQKGHSPALHRQHHLQTVNFSLGPVLCEQCGGSLHHDNGTENSTLEQLRLGETKYTYTVYNIN